ncbi:hypothetical protein C5167_038880 [Papaver somniferum]|uniref:Uncharacterized protein n=1 Tax=Papaver somniferum TaxID=3469 RepID=A0A4Y7IE17_PAPSO|nr:hypothetical protein C5167_038880 [Papaver somniferum]
MEESSSSSASNRGKKAVPLDINDEYKPKIKGNSVNGEFVKDFYDFVEDETNVDRVECYMTGRAVEVNNVKKLVAAAVPKLGNEKHSFTNCIYYYGFKTYPTQTEGRIFCMHEYFVQGCAYFLTMVNKITPKNHTKVKLAMYAAVKDRELACVDLDKEFQEIESYRRG